MRLPINLLLYSDKIHKGMENCQGGTAASCSNCLCIARSSPFLSRRAMGLGCSRLLNGYLWCRNGAPSTLPTQDTRFSLTLPINTPFQWGSEHSITLQLHQVFSECVWILKIIFKLWIHNTKQQEDEMFEQLDQNIHFPRMRRLEICTSPTLNRAVSLAV